MDMTLALPTFFITLREGVEAALVVGIVLAYLNQARQTALNRWVYSGIGLGIGGSLLVGVAFLSLLQAVDVSHAPYAPLIKQVLEGGFGIVAIALLSWMLLWMTRQAKSLKAELEGSIHTLLQSGDQAGWGVLSLVAIAVLREGFETVIFISAQVQQGWMPVLGAIAGLVGAVMIGLLLFQLGVKINLRLFFQGMGLVLLLIVSGLVVSALRHLDAAVLLASQLNPAYAHWCSGDGSCILGPQVWDLSDRLPDRQFPGLLLKAFLGYTQRLYLAQAIDYLVFLTIVGGIYWQSLTGWTPRTKRSPNP